MELENLSYPDALRWLARKYNIEIRERELSDEEKRQEARPRGDVPCQRMGIEIL